MNPLALLAGGPILGASNMYDSITGEPELAGASDSEVAELEMLQAMRESWNTTGLPAQREKIAQTIGKRWNPETGAYEADGNNQAKFDADGNVKQSDVRGGANIAGVSQAYEAQRPAFDPNQNARSSIQGDIAQAKDEAGAQAQTAATSNSNALVAAGNLAGIAHGAQMNSLQDMNQLSQLQATEANANAANSFGQSTNNRNALAGLAGAGFAANQYMQQNKQPLPYTQANGIGVG